MRATITYLNLNDTFTDRKGNEWDCAILRVQPDPERGQEQPEKEYRVFPGTAVYDKLNQFKKGDYVDLKFTRRGRFWDLSDIRHASYPGNPNSGGAAIAPANVKVDIVDPKSLMTFSVHLQAMVYTLIYCINNKTKIKTIDDISNVYEDTLAILFGNKQEAAEQQPDAPAVGSDNDIPF